MIVVTELEVLEAGFQWTQTGWSTALATVIETWGSAPRKAGSQLVIRQDGLFVGSVSGGCVEGAVVQQTLKLLAEGQSGQLLSFGVSTEDAWSVDCPAAERFLFGWNGLADVLQGLISPFLEVLWGLVYR